MNKFIKIIGTALFTLTVIVSFAQTIPNEGFENWTMAGPMESPDGWAGTPLTTKSQDVHSGSFAIKIVAGTFTNPMTMTTDTLPGIANTGMQGMGPGSGTRGFAFAARPDSIIGWYKYTPVGNDNPVIRVVLSKWDANTSTSEMIANSMYVGSSQGAYTRFSFPIEYMSTTIPDSANIELLSSNSPPMQPLLGSVLLVDDLSFVYNSSAGINTVKSNGINISVYPNPTHDKLFVDVVEWNQASTTVKVTDALGRTVLSLKTPNLQNGIDVSQIGKGIFTIHLVNNATMQRATKTFLVD